MTSFCSISLILLLHRPFELLNLIFAKYLWGSRLLNMTRGTIWQNIFWYHVSYLTYDVICDVILLYFNNFTNLIWFLQHVHHVWSCLTWSEEHYSKYFLDIIFCFQLMASFVTSFCYIRCFLEQNLICRKCLSWFKLSKKIRGTIWLNTFLIPCLILHVTSFFAPFCYISLNLQLHCLLEHLHLIFTKCFSWWKLFKMIRGTFWQHVFLISPLIFSPMTSFVTSFCYISLILELHHLEEKRWF